MSEKEYIASEYKTLAEDLSIKGRLSNMLASGYGREELQQLPEKSIMGIACGNPVSHCNLQPGMRYLDLGCGTGMDVLLAGLKVAPDGRAIGLDFLPEMVERAKICAEECEGLPADVTDFQVADLNAGPLNFPDASFDAVTGNCCIHFLNQQLVFQEIHRVLKPGGIFVFSEVAKKAVLPEDLHSLMLEAFEKSIFPAENTVTAKCFRTYVSIAQKHTMETEKVLQLLSHLNFSEQHTISSRPVPGTEEKSDKPFPYEALKMTSNKVNTEEVRLFSLKLQAVFDRINVNDFASFDTVSARKTSA